MSEIKITTASSDDVENRNRQTSRPTYIEEMKSKWVKWTDIDDDEILEALDYISGDLYFEMRKLTSKSCQQNERALERMTKNLDKLLGDKEKLKDIFEIVNFELEKLKKETKSLIDSSWRDIVDKQKVGLDKVCIVITRHRYGLQKEKKVNKTKTKKEDK